MELKQRIIEWIEAWDIEKVPINADNTPELLERKLNELRKILEDYS